MTMSPSIAQSVLRRVFNVHDGAIVFVARTSLFSLLSKFILFTPILVVEYFISGNHDSLDNKSFSVADTLVFAPIFENICLIGVIEMQKTFDCRSRSIVLFVAILFGIAHIPAGGLSGINAAICFAIMSYSYLVWSESRFAKRYWITVFQHMLMNTPATLMFVIAD